MGAVSSSRNTSFGVRANLLGRGPTVLGSGIILGSHTETIFPFQRLLGPNISICSDLEQEAAIFHFFVL